MPTGAELADFYGAMERQRLIPLWKVYKDHVPRTPSPRAQPHLWRFREVLPLVRASGALAPMTEGERRVLGFANPGLPYDGLTATTDTLWGAFQYILPGEKAHTHRHAAAAIRFILEGEGASTTVEGERCALGPGDFVLTPPWAWHDHENTGEKPVIWMDGLDIIMVRELRASFFEGAGEAPPPAPRPEGGSLARWAEGALRPAWERQSGPYSPLLLYKWERTERALRRLAASGEASPHDDVAMDFVHPGTGGPVYPTMGCRIQLLRPGRELSPHRHTGSAVYLCFKGSGHSVIDGQRFDWERGDAFCVPSWARHQHAAGEEETILFSINDQPMIEALGLYREEG
ncbi:MAG: cupin domain-containing protein [Candidatus Tectomicrobia bacterium]|uniref:Cupin domain-containing protein n=1 Tax=Tectimicrobiota bacterium TaxID=2528274 RepID=A0A932I0X7_UNCTE|nr:cupin domain-containing protein [Candidatus Tectomicrobia bacterium]